VSIPRWEIPEFAASELTYVVTSSVLEQFAQGHTVGDILRELVQNEYDADGGSLSVTFGTAGLEVRGSGRVIDQAGWRRLSVMLGTGRVAGENRDVPQKVNGIGSKNHGLRSLFLIGNEIYIRSGGYQTVLDLRRGALREPRLDPASASVPGAHVFVPYRQEQDGQLEAYGPTREAQDVALLADHLAATLVKLAQPGSQRSLRTVTVSSAREDRVLIWRQNVKLLRRHRLRGPVLERTIQLRDGAASADSLVAKKIAELEYQKSFIIPSEFRSRVFPDYFHVSGGRLRIGISLRLKRKRPHLEDVGAFYYPLGFTNSSTGSAVSVSAPFEMNADRSALIDPASNTWNDWLMEAASEFTLDLLTNEWLDSFGGDAFLALENKWHGSVPQFAAKISAGLQSRACWPSREREKGSRRPRLRIAKDIMLATIPEFQELVGDSRLLDSRLADPQVVGMARNAGARDFTMNSVIRLRCAGQDASHLITKLGTDAALYYPKFVDALEGIDLQKKFGRVFDTQRQLTSANRSDLKEAPTTLTAADTLAAPSQPLWVVDEAVATVSPVPMTQRLHPELFQYRTIRRLCQPFDVSAWARNVASQANDGTVGEEDREALYLYMLRTPEAISRAVWPALRRVPILRDHRTDWVPASEMIQRRAAGAARIEAALHFPSREITNNPALQRRLKIRPKLVGTDLVRYAWLVAEQPALAEGFEESLIQFQVLLTRPAVAALGSVPFLRSTHGGLVAPRDAYLRTSYLVKCVGQDANFAAGRHTALHSRLGCRTKPEAADIVLYLESLRAAASGPLHPEVVYPALLEALRLDGNVSRLADDQILFADGEWHAPAKVLVGKKHRQIFLGAVPVIAASALDHVYESFGASGEPAAAHWIRFFDWMESNSDSGRRVLRSAERKALRLAYAKLGSRPAGVPDHWHTFLATTGRLYSTNDVNAKRYLINDDPRTADAAAAADLPIAFADMTDASTRRFYRSSGVSLLTEARQHIGVEVGDRRSNPPWFQEPRELDHLRQPDFVSAVHAVATSAGSHSAVTERQLRRRLREIAHIIFVTELKDLYRIGPFKLNVPSDVAIDGDRIALRFIRGRAELYGLLARAVASMAEATVALQQPLTDSIFRLIMSDSPADLERYLTQRGIAWTAGKGQHTDDESADDEESDNRAQVAESLKEKLLQPPPSPSGTQRTNQHLSGNGHEPRQPETRSRTLPPLEDVSMSEAAATGWTLDERERTAHGGGGGTWRSRSPAEQEQDRLVGARGEELVYREELKRVRSLGYPESRVIWTSRSNPAADHDILSVADDGGELWLEVKSTTGRHGRFDWPRAEFERALRAGERYILCRVYEAHTTNPTLRREQDPVAKLLGGAMRLDIASLAAEVAPLST
jgi:Domain of unknown function (DUF3883)